jgi:hypothetical protein
VLGPALRGSAEAAGVHHTIDVVVTGEEPAMQHLVAVDGLGVAELLEDRVRVVTELLTEGSQLDAGGYFAFFLRLCGHSPLLLSGVTPRPLTIVR